IYISIYSGFGLLGLIAFLFGMYYSFLKVLLSRSAFGKSKERSAYALSILIYAVVAFSDGGILFIPVMALFYLVNYLLVTTPSQKEIAISESI
ncbi:MAG: hypothetical protein WCN87_02895, partial [Chlamydiota bacterium]